MAGLLISVKNPEEALTVARFPVAILDIKNPENGALGAASRQDLQEIVRALADREPSNAPKMLRSFSAGELIDWASTKSNSTIPAFYGAELVEQFAFVKIGLAGMAKPADWKQRWQKVFESLPAVTQPVAVAYLDHGLAGAPPPADVIEFATEQSECSTILFDTFDKSGDLFDSLNGDELKRIVSRSRSGGLATVVAGSVSRSNLGIVLVADPDYIGVRGAVCNGTRESVAVWLGLQAFRG